MDDAPNIPSPQPATSAPRLLIAAGGTGGHVYPGLAVARELRRRRPSSSITFAASARGLEQELLRRAGYSPAMVRVAPLRGGSLFRWITGLAVLPLAFGDAFRLLRKTDPDAVMGVGGYLSGPLLLTASRLGIPTLLLEPNVVPGFTNRQLARVVDAAAVGWPRTAPRFGDRAFVSGTPVRPDIAEVEVPTFESRVRLLVVGGSQGSRNLNSAVVEALPGLAPLAGRLRVTHQTGAGEGGGVERAYRAHGLEARVEPYLERMAEEYGRADLVLARAGAVTCAEIAVCGRPCVLLPLPAAGDHQRLNARAMEEGGAAVVIEPEELSGEVLAGTLVKLVESPRSRRRMAEAARSLARPDAAGAIVDRLLEISRA